MNKQITLKANAKINLNLEILNKRNDGYHNISTIMQSVSLADVLEIKLTEDNKVRVICVKAQIVGENIVNSAAALFLKQAGIKKGVEICLTKNIPLSSGMGGGSSDAAATLIGLNMLFDKPFDEAQLLKMGLSLGADVPFCLMGGTIMAEGVGEKLSPISSLPKMPVVIIKAYDKDSTGAMYNRADSIKAKRESKTLDIVKRINAGEYKKIAPLCRNDFLLVSKDKVSQEKVINKLTKMGAFLSGMSGSGPTVFGIFEKDEDIDLNKLKELYGENVYLCHTENVSVKEI